MDLSDIKALIALMGDASLSEIEVEDGKRRIRIRRETAAFSAAPAPKEPAASESAAPVESETVPGKAQHYVTSPIVGTFYTAPSPNANPYVEVGDLVKKGQVLCIVEAMKLMNEIESDVDGRVVKICVEDGAAVEYGEPLMAIEPA